MHNAVLVGDRVYLRPIEPTDSDTISEIATLEDETVVDIHGRVPLSPTAIGQWIERTFRTMPPDWIDFAVCLKETDKCIGFVGVNEIDWVHRHGETYSSLLPGGYRGVGYGTEAKHLLLEFCFDHIGLHVLVSWVWSLNERSAAALAKQGYRPAGRLKYEGINKGVYRDELVFDLLREDWVKARDAWRASVQG